ncbi:MAG: hypothetical protein H7123_06725 [Thermoleophilia bacterium]|nr:hypothetical protein [Thermoleophilia bacterium]
MNEIQVAPPRKKLRTPLIVASAIAIVAAFTIGGPLLWSRTHAKQARHVSASSNLSVAVGDMFITAKATSVKAGNVHVHVKNSGRLGHEVVFLKVADAHEMLRPGAGSRLSEKNSVGEVADIAAHGSKSGTVKLSPGTYQMVCNLAGHYMAGMHAPLIVT